MTHNNIMSYFSSTELKPGHVSSTAVVLFRQIHVYWNWLKSDYSTCLIQLLLTQWNLFSLRLSENFVYKLVSFSDFYLQVNLIDFEKWWCQRVTILEYGVNTRDIRRSIQGHFSCSSHYFNCVLMQHNSVQTFRPWYWCKISQTKKRGRRWFR